MPNVSKEVKKDDRDICFVIMPFSDMDDYNPGHFIKVYNYILKPAIEKAGYKPHRIDFEVSSNLIQEKIIRQLIEAPMVLCDLSSRNPNVLFELGMRQAFDKPVVLVKDNITERIFDISGLSTIDYRMDCIVDEVEEDVNKIAQAIIETKEDNHFNSLIRLLKVNSADIDSGKVKKENLNDDYNTFMLKKIYSMLEDLKDSNISNNTENFKSVDPVYVRNEFKRRYRNLNTKIKSKPINLNELRECKDEIYFLRKMLDDEYVFDAKFRDVYMGRLVRYEVEIDSIIDKVV